MSAQICFCAHAPLATLEQPKEYRHRLPDGQEQFKPLMLVEPVEAGGSGWNLVQYVSVAYQNLSIESRIRFNVMLVAQKGRGMICQIVPNSNKYSMAFQISQADLVNKQITAPHSHTTKQVYHVSSTIEFVEVFSQCWHFTLRRRSKSQHFLASSQRFAPLGHGVKMML